MTYRVTQQDIDAGLRGEPRDCPIARAIKRRHPTRDVRVCIYHVHIGGKYHELPQQVSMWVCLYDDGKDVRPIRFELL